MFLLTAAVCGLVWLTKTVVFASDPKLLPSVIFLALSIAATIPVSVALTLLWLRRQ
jgi:hypothetical protein